MPLTIAVPDEILTERLRLRRHNVGDVEAFQDFMADPESTRFMDFAAEQKTAAGAEAMMRGVTDLYDSETPVFSMTITLRSIDRYLGSCGLSQTSDDGVLEIFFTLIPSAQGHGYATEAVEAMIEFAQGRGARRMVAKVFDGNRPSVGVLQRAGFVLSQTIEDDLTPASIYTRDL